MLTKDELIKIGVNPDNLNYPNGEMSIIVQCFGVEEKNLDSLTELAPDIYHPRKNDVWSCGCQGDCVPFSNEEEKADWVLHLKDSAERLKIMSYYLMKQAEEIEKYGFPSTDCYYPE